MQDQLAPVDRVAVFEQVHALPATELKPSPDHRNGETDLGQGRTNMGGHVIWPLKIMSVEPMAPGNETGEGVLEISAHVRVRVLLDQEGT